MTPAALTEVEAAARATAKTLPDPDPEVLQALRRLLATAVQRNSA